METYLIDLIIPTYNKSTRLRLVLESLCYQIMPKEQFKVIIVDDGSTDDTSNVVNDYITKLNINYIYQNNSGRSHARNTGLNAADASIVVFVDDDVILSNAFISSHYELHQKFDNSIVHGKIYELPYLKFFSDPSLGTILQSDTLSLNTDTSGLTNYLITTEDVRTLEKIDKQKRTSSFEKYIFTILTRAIQHENLHKLDFIGCTGANLSGKKEVFENVDGFDESFGRLWGCEDVEMGYRLQKKGVKILYLDKACNYHITHLRQNYKEALLKAYELFYMKHQDPIIKLLPKLLLNEIKDVYKFCDYLTEKS
ncbi:glycosyltransferase [Clostridium sp. BNL1100]|uniref:glycosyltransferase n=1 Tax=Clostridium sp. BNL1100 TaxID=755731 RepID=UPI00024A784F|nr:glycosyltransferase [Clostridium sp. BNL1100]AEY67378.1 glycosyl transferase [Clostridium sp. BNL1100]